MEEIYQNISEGYIKFDMDFFCLSIWRETVGEAFNDNQITVISLYVNT